MKYVLLPGVLFEELGFKYYGPVDGHNLRDLLQVLKNIQQVKGPVFLHVLTQKGKGYALAERESLKFHGTEPFDLKTGKATNEQKQKTYTDVVSDVLVAVGKKNPELVAITAAMPTGTGLAQFKEHFPERFFDVGIAEGHAVTFAAGMAKTGLRPIVAVYSTFLQRAYDQIIHDVCIQNLPVVFLLDRSGVVAADGETHQGVFDISFLTHMPNMTILAPRSSEELAAMLEFAVNLGSPVAIRYPKDTVSSVFINNLSKIELGKWEVLENGSKIALLSLGSMLDKCAAISQKLREIGHNPSLIDARFAKPFCQKNLRELSDYDFVFTFEENVLLGGFGQYIAAQLQAASTKVHNFAICDGFLPQGTRKEVFEHVGLDEASMFAKILEVVQSD